MHGKRFFGTSHWEIPGTNGNSEKVVALFSGFGRSELEISLPFTVS